MKLVLAILLSFLFFVADGASSFGNEVPMSMEGAPPGVVWVVQMSDIHLSKWTPARGLALRKALSQTLKSIQPAIVLVTGDLTDAKSKDMATTQQEEVEWIEYRDSFQHIAESSGIPLQNFFDLRGNHDKYGVPLLSSLDYHSKYSISAAMNRSSLVQSVTVQGDDGRKHLFVGFDDSMKVGLRGPSNVFGHPTDEILVQLDQELRIWDDDSTPVTKIVYGHFPMSFTTSSETGKRVEDVIASNNVTAYVCGHLHTTFGRQLYKHHKEHSGDFWEWEMGDWRISRMMRVMAIDQGHTSFVDVELIPPEDPAVGDFTMPTVILQTYPLESRYMLQHSPKGAAEDDSNSIRALVFSETTPVWVVAIIYDTSSHSPKKVNSTFMKETSVNASGGAHYFTVGWDWERYVHKKCAIQIAVKSSNGNVSYSQMRLTSANGEPGNFHLAFLAYLLFGIKWQKVVPKALCSTISLLILLLVASPLFCLWRKKNGTYQEWMTSVFRPPWTFTKIFKRPFGGLVELFSRNRFVWSLLFSYVLYLVLFPWFSGHVLADDYPSGSMSLYGWTVKPSIGASVHEVSGLGIPDNTLIVVSYLYGVLIPLFLVVSFLSAERTAFEIDRKIQGKCLNPSKRNGDSQEDTESNQSIVMIPGDKQIDEGSSDLQRSLFNGKTRIALFGCCVVILFILFKLCLMIGRAYGFSAPASAPVYAWSVPVLLVISFYQTSRISCRCTGCLHLEDDNL